MEDTYASPDDLRRVFRELLDQLGSSEAHYDDVWRAARDRGLHVRGATPKKQRDAVFRALASDPEVQKVRPGVFSLAK